MAQKLTVVVTGSTGKQGGAVARGLLERGHKVRAVTRDPNSSQAKLLANAGAALVVASLEDTAAITKALEGATSLFADDGAVRRYGRRDTTGCRVGRCSQGSWRASRLHFRRLRQPTDGRSALRQQVRGRKTHCQSRRRATILAPVAFMENLYFIKEQLATGVYASALSPTRALAQVAVPDIGAVAIRVLEDSARFTGKRFDLAGDELTGNEAMAILSRVIGRSFSYFQVPLDVVRQRMGEDAVKMYEWFDRVGFAVDRAALRREFSDVDFQNFESWAKAQDWNALLQSA